MSRMVERQLRAKKTASIIQLMEQMVKTKVWKVLRGINAGDDKY